MGNAGQAHYAAANAFLDAYAHWRADRGASPRVSSLGWGPWAGVGFATTVAAAENLARQELIGALAPDAGAALFERTFDAPAPHLLPMRVKVRPRTSLGPAVASLFDELLTKASPVESDADGLVGLSALSGREQEARARAWLRRACARPLGVAPSRLAAAGASLIAGLRLLLWSR